DNRLKKIINDWWKLKTHGLNSKNALITLNIPHLLANEISILWFTQIEDLFWSYFDAVFVDFFDFYAKCKLQKIDLFLLTARTNKMVLQQQLYNVGIYHFFKKIFVVNHQNVIENKAVILKKNKPEFFIGDTETDFQAAQLSSTKFICSTRGQRTLHFFNNYKIDIFFNNFNHLNNLI
ncbi:MAG: HAD family hydrolase, partial [Sediminibacterium sp.]|nr:HAD family hydrolase [Sediminibacterium sp.]